MNIKPTSNAGPGFAKLLHARAIDGDSIEAWTEPFPGIRIRNRFRLRGFYAPELDGAIPEQGRAARDVLQALLDAGNCTVNTDHPRQDKYGRFIVVLYEHGKAIDPFAAIFPYQLTPEAHAQDLIAARRNRAGKRGAL